MYVCLFSCNSKIESLTPCNRMVLEKRIVAHVVKQ
jgi:hypothetical protein